MSSVFPKDTKWCGKRKECRSRACSHFPTLFSRASFRWIVKVLPKDSILDPSKFKVCANKKKKTILTEKKKVIDFWPGNDRKYCSKRRKCKSTAFTLYPSVFLK